VIRLFGLEKRCDQYGTEIEGDAEVRYFRTFCSKEHVAGYFGSYIGLMSSGFPSPPQLFKF
jgi:hypothetical protein